MSYLNAIKKTGVAPPPMMKVVSSRNPVNEEKQEQKTPEMARKQDGPPRKIPHSGHKMRTAARCNRCGDFGHAAMDCRTKICSYCDTRGHTRDHCFSDPDNCCTNCGTYGHNANECQLCKRCGDFGHESEECRTKICEECGKRGHLSSSCWFNKMCDRCGLKGHIEQACRTRLWCSKCQEAHRKCDINTEEEDDSEDMEIITNK